MHLLNNTDVQIYTIGSQKTGTKVTKNVKIFENFEIAQNRSISTLLSSYTHTMQLLTVARPARHDFSDFKILTFDFKVFDFFVMI